MMKNRMSRRGILGAAAALSAGLALPPAFAKGGYHITKIEKKLDRLTELLEGLPYVTEQAGKGFPLYAFLTPECPYCMAFWRDHKKGKLSVEYRFVPAPYGTPEVVLAAARNPSPATFEAFMAKTLRPVKGGSSSANVAQFNAMHETWEEIRDIVHANGGRSATPLFVWVKDGKTEAVAGYEGGAFGGLIAYWFKGE